MPSTFTTNYGFEEIATGEQSGTWGTTTNFNFDILDRITAFKAVALSDASTATLTVREASPGTGTENLQDGMYRVIKFTGALSQNCTVTIAPNTTSAYFIFINATTDSGSSGPYTTIISQGSGANYTVANGTSALVYCDGAGGGAVVAAALVESLTTRGDIVVRNASNLTSRLAVGSANTALLSDGTDVAYGSVSLTAGVTGTLPIANGGTNSTSTTYCSLTANVSGTLPIANGGTNSTSTTYCGLTSNVTGTLPIANGGTNSTSTTYCDLTSNVTGTLPVSKGGTGAATHTANGVLIGEGTSAMTTVAPSTDGNVLTSDGTDWVSEAPASAGFTLSTEQAGAAADLTFTGIPAGTTMVVVNMSDMSSSSTGLWTMEIGDSGGLETSNYNTRGKKFNNGNYGDTDGTAVAFAIANSGHVAQWLECQVILTLENSSTNNWMMSSNAVGRNNDDAGMSNGSKALSGTLTQLKINPVGSFDDGVANIMYI